MKFKSIIVSVLILLSVFYVKAQVVPIANYCKPKKADKPFCGITKERTFAGIINTNITKDELIKKTKGFFVNEQLIDSATIEVVEYDESLAEYKLQFMFRQNFLNGTMRGVKVVKPPLKLYFDAILSFNKEGQIMVTFENLNEETFAMAKDKKFDNTTPLEKYPKLEELVSTALFENPGFLLKALVWANNGIDEVKKLNENRGEFRRMLNESFYVFDKLVDEGKAVWLTDTKMLEYTMPHNKYFVSIVQKNIDEEKFVTLDNERWLYFERNFSYFIYQISTLVGGEIESMARDGEIIYEK